MKPLTAILRGIVALSLRRPLWVILFFLLLSIAGFASMPHIVVSTNLMAGVGEANPVINLTKENTERFGEQDSLIIVLEFPEPPGERRLPFIQGIAEAVKRIEGVRRVRYRLLDPEDPKQVERFVKHFLAAMDQEERETISKMLSAEGIEGALRRTRNRLFLAENPYVQRQLLEDPLEMGQFMAKTMEKRVGSVSVGDMFLLIAGPNANLFLIAVTPEFSTSEILKVRHLVEKVRALLPKRIKDLNDELKIVRDPKDIKWSLTGKAAFQYESDIIFDEETASLLLISFGLVSGIFLIIYRSFISSVILMIPLIAGIGPSYGFLYLAYSDVNPVVMGATGVLMGLGAEYGVHLWGRFREELDAGFTFKDAMLLAYERTGPPVLLGALTGIIAFLCLCFSSQPALVQFGFFGAMGLALTCISTLFLVPALAKLLSRFKRELYPRLMMSFSGIAHLFLHKPGAITVVSILVILVSAFFATKVTYEKDLFKVFLAGGMESMAVSNKISKSFHSNFAQPTLLSFDVEDLQSGLRYQRQLDGIIQDLMQRDRDIASFDSISYMLAPDTIRQKNATVLKRIADRWGLMRNAFDEWLSGSDLSGSASAVVKKSFDGTGRIVADLAAGNFDRPDPEVDLERSWYRTKIAGKWRFLTQIRYADRITDPAQLKRVDQRLTKALKAMPTEVKLSGTRQTMEAVLSSLVSELFRLGLYAFFALSLIFFAIFPNPLGVGLCLIPMIGSFAITLGAIAVSGKGLPFSIVCVAPLVFGFSIHNGIHVVMGSLHEHQSNVETTMARVTPRAVLTSLTIMAGFVAMITSRHYSMQFLGWAMVLGMLSAVPLTLVTLPAMLYLIERFRGRTSPDTNV